LQSRKFWVLGCSICRTCYNLTPFRDIGG
jgi:hypothetical protein